MKASLIILALLLAAGPAGAQLYRWVDKDGKVRYGDAPPPGAKTSTIRAPAPGSAPPPTASKDGTDAKDAKKGPLTPAEQDQEYRKRQAEAKKIAEKADEEGRAKAERAEGCDRAKEQLSTLESGERIARTNSSGERYFLNESQVAQEVVKSRQSMQQACK